METIVFENVIVNCGKDCVYHAYQNLKWIFCFVPFMVHGFIKSAQLFVSFINNSNPVEIFN